MVHWYRLRIWLHGLFYQADCLPAFRCDVIVCDCGGHARVYRNDDGTNTVSNASCPVWAWADRARQRPLPPARLLP